MAPSFFDPVSSSSSSLFTTDGSSQSAASANSLPTLSIVLGLIGALFALIFIAGTCIYTFRRRLFPPPTKAIDDMERTGTQSKLETADSNRSVYFSGGADEVVSHEEVGQSVGSRPDLRPSLLNPVRPVRSFYGALPVEDYATLSTLRISLSCPACLGQSKNTFDDSASSPKAVELPPKTRLEDPTLVSRPSPPRSLFLSFDSSGSFYSQESNSSSDSSDPSDSLPWDYYINSRHEDLFYSPEPLSSPAPSSPGSEEVLFATTVRRQPEQESGANFHSNFVSPPKRLRIHVQPSSKRASSSITARRREFCSSKANSRAIFQALKIHILRSRTSRCASARSDPLRSRFSDPTVSGESPSDDSLISDNSLVLKPDSQASTPSTTQVSAVKPLDTHPSQTSHPSFYRQLLGAITNTYTASNEGNAPLEGDSEMSAVQPSFLLNDVPARDLTTTTAPRFNRLKSPPRNPALLNTRWMPRPDIPPLKITVFVKDRCNFNLRYLGRRITLTPIAGTPLAELRGSIEQKLRRDVRMLRGMVFVGSRSMFLPLVTQSFYVQWVKERVRDGGAGIVEAWLH